MTKIITKFDPELIRRAVNRIADPVIQTLTPVLPRVILATTVLQEPIPAFLPVRTTVSKLQLPVGPVTQTVIPALPRAIPAPVVLQEHIHHFLPARQTAKPRFIMY